MRSHATLNDLGVQHFGRYRRDSDIRSLNNAIELFGQALVAAPADHPDRVPILVNLAQALRLRFEARDDPADLDVEVTCWQEISRRTPDDAPARAWRLANLANAHRRRFSRRLDPHDIDEAIRVGEIVAAITPGSDPDYAGRLSNLGISYRKRSEASRHRSDAEMAVSRGFAAVRATPASDPECAGRWSNLALAHLTRFEQDGAIDDLDEALRGWNAALGAGPSAESDSAMYSANLCAVHQLRYLRAGDIQDLDEAIHHGATALDLTGPDDLDYCVRLSNLAGAYRRRFQRAGAREDLEEAFALAEAAVQASGTGDLKAADQLSELALVYVLQSQFLGDDTAADKAVRAARKATAINSGTPPKAVIMSVLALAEHERFVRAGEASDLDASIRHAQSAVDTAVSLLERAAFQQDLAFLRNARFYLRGVPDDLDDLDEAVTLLTRTLLAPGADGHLRARSLLALSAAHLMRFQNSRKRADADRAFECAAELLKLKDYFDYRDAAIFLGNAYLMRFDYFGERDGEELALATCKAALERADAGSRSTALIEGTLGRIYYTLYQQTESADLLNQAIELQRSAAEVTADRLPVHAEILARLGIALLDRYDRDGDRADFTEALRSFRSAATLLRAPAAARFAAAERWADLSVTEGNVAQAVEACTVAIDLLPFLAWHGMSRPARENRLKDVEGFARDAAAWATDIGRPQLAIEFLESGRTVLWWQALQTRADLTRLQVQHPELAARLDELRRTLDRSWIPFPPAVSPRETALPPSRPRGD
jgi:hypothetical protein